MMMLDILMSVYQGCLIVYTLKKQFVQKTHSFLHEIACVALIVLYLFLIQYLELPFPDSLLFLFPLAYVKLTSNERFLICALWVTLDGFLFMCTLTVISSLFNVQIGLNGGIIDANNETLMIYSFFGNAAITVVLNIAARINKVKDLANRKEMILFLAMLIISFVIDECFFLARISIENKEVLLVGSMCAFTVMVLTMVLYERMVETTQKQKLAELEAQTMKLLNEHQDELKSMYQNMLAEQHDLRHRVAAAEEILRSSLVDDKQRCRVLALLQDEVPTRSFITGSMAVDAILKAKSTIMDNVGISFEFVEYPLLPLPISEQSLCILLGNLLDNAIEGVMRLPATASSRHIRLTFSKVWNMLFITCINDADMTKINRQDDIFISTKDSSDIHGFGTMSMKKIVNEAGGTIEFEVAHGQFTVQIMIGGKQNC